MLTSHAASTCAVPCDKQQGGAVHISWPASKHQTQSEQWNPPCFGSVSRPGSLAPLLMQQCCLRQVLLMIMKCPGSHLLTNSNVIGIIQACFRIGHYMPIDPSSRSAQQGAPLPCLPAGASAGRVAPQMRCRTQVYSSSSWLCLPSPHSRQIAAFGPVNTKRAACTAADSRSPALETCASSEQRS